MGVRLRVFLHLFIRTTLPLCRKHVKTTLIMCMSLVSRQNRFFDSLQAFVILSRWSHFFNEDLLVGKDYLFNQKLLNFHGDCRWVLQLQHCKTFELEAPQKFCIRKITLQMRNLRARVAQLSATYTVNQRQNWPRAQLYKLYSDGLSRRPQMIMCSDVFQRHKWTSSWGRGFTVWICCLAHHL